MSWKKIAVEFTGVLPTLMHNGQLADPMNPFAKAMKEITGKRKKTDQDYLDLSQLEFFGSLYLNGRISLGGQLDEGAQICWPGINIHRCIQSGAKKSSKGKDVDAGILVDGFWPLKYDGPADPVALFNDNRFRNYSPAGVNKNRVMRTRPQFPEWSIQFELYYMPDVCNPSDIRRWCEIAGIYIGLSDWRPRFGRYEVTKFTELDDTPTRNGRIRKEDFATA